MKPVFESRKTANYLRLCLNSLPNEYTSYDLQRLSLVFFCVTGLDLLGEDVDKGITDWIYHLQHPSGGFKEAHGEFAHVGSTFFAIMTLAVLKDDLKRLDVVGLVKWLKKLKGKAFLYHEYPSGEDDFRYDYFHACLHSLLGTSGEDIAIPATSTKKHAGEIFCRNATLELLDLPLQFDLKQLVNLQNADGGFAGRINKPSDTCYGFWVLSTLKLNNMQHLINTDELRSHLTSIECTFGGWPKANGYPADPMHTCLALLALAICNDIDIDPVYCCRRSATSHLSVSLAKLLQYYQGSQQ